MKFLVQVICVSEAVERREQVFEMEREHLTMETLGLGLGDSKALLRGVQEFVVAEHVAADLETTAQVSALWQTAREQSSRQYQGEDSVWPGRGAESTLVCQSIGPSTFRPMTSWLAGRTGPELLYLAFISKVLS